jgi:hypothetical protein
MASGRHAYKSTSMQILAQAYWSLGSVLSMYFPKALPIDFKELVFQQWIGRFGSPEPRTGTTLGMSTEGSKYGVHRFKYVNI